MQSGSFAFDAIIEITVLEGCRTSALLPMYGTGERRQESENLSEIMLFQIFYAIYTQLRLKRIHSHYGHFQVSF